MKKRLWEKKINKWYLIGIAFVLVLIAGLVLMDEATLKNIFTDALCYFELDATSIKCKMRMETDFIGGAIWTMTTILASFLCFYYSSVKYRNYGIANRKIMSYTYGSCFLPILVLVNCVIVLFMTFSYYAQLYVDFYIYVVFSCAFQASEMFICLQATAQKQSAKTILKIEKAQYKYFCKNMKNYDANNFEDASEVTNPIIFHIESVLEGDETWSEKGALIQAMLAIPFKTEFNKEGYCYLYWNVKKIAVYANQNPQMAQPIYNLFYEHFKTVLMQAKEKKHMNSQQYNMILMYIGAIFVAFIPQSELKERWAFFVKLIKMQKEDWEEKHQMTLLLFAALVYSFYMRRIEQSMTLESREIDKCFESLKEYWKNADNETDTKLEDYISMWMIDINTDKKRKYAQIYAIKKALKYDKEMYIRYLMKYVLGGKK